MKLNNKGITLIEIIISVALISIVLVFLFSLLIQVNNENADNEVNSSYLVHQSTFTKQIEEDFIEYKLQSGASCTTSDVSKTEATKPLYLPKLKSTPDFTVTSSSHNIKCLKFTLDNGNITAFLFLYKTTNDETALSYYRGDFKQSVKLENFDWNENKNNIKDDDASTDYKVYSLPIIGPDNNDYSLNLSYAS